MASFRAISTALLLSTISNAANGQSVVPISTYTDTKCNIASTTARNVSIPLDTCITTVGMVSFTMDALPCAGGGLTAVKSWGFSDANCNNRFTYYNYGDKCAGAFDDNEAFGSILLTCTDSGSKPPTPQGTPTTINVGPVVTGAPASSGTAGSGSNSSSGSGSGSSSDCHGWSCLSNGARIGIILGASFLGLAFVSGCITSRIRRRSRIQGAPVYSQPQPFGYTKTTTERMWY